MPPDKTWLDQHFGKPTNVTPPSTASGSGFRFGILLASILAVLSGVLVLDYTNTVAIGVVEKLGLDPLKPRTSPTLLSAERESTQSYASPGGLFGHDASAPSLPSEDSEIAAPPASVAPNHITRDRADSLRRGIDLLQRELLKVDSAEIGPLFQITIRKHPFEPYSAAERVKMADDYLSSGRNWTPTQLVAIHDERTRSIAQVTNAQIRLKELSKKRQSVTVRLEKAQSELGVVP